MADIRINSLPTTASASSSDDFLALDGATNGTRKLNAYSPTFGGNLTVSGTGTSSVAGNWLVGTTTDTGGRLVVDKASQVAASSTASGGIVVSNLAGGNAVLELGANATYLGYIQTRNYTTGSYYQLNLNPVAGNVLIGTTTDGGQKLQVSGAIAATTGAANNALVARYNSSNSLFGVTVNSAGQGVVSENTDASTGSDKYSKTGLPAFRLGNTGGSGTVPFWIDVAASGTAGNAITWTNAFQIDSSQNATFAGTVYAGASSNIGWNGRAYLSALADGKVQVTNWANNGTSMLVLGAAASTSYPMLKRNGTGIDVRLADDSAFATFRALDFSAQGAATTVGANQVSYGGTTATTATAGAQTLPANPVGFIIVNVAGTTAKIPYYAN